MNQSPLNLQELSCARGGRPLFKGLNLVLETGECVEVRGPNGSGKSTLLRIVAGLFPDYEGRIEVVRSFYLGHRPAVSALLSPRENLQWCERIGASAPLASPRGARPSVAQALRRVGLALCAETPCGQLSQGQQRRVGLARALLCDAALWLLDEPLTALDAQGRTLVDELVGEHCAAGGSVLCATHQSLATSHTTRAVQLGPIAQTPLYGLEGNR